MARFTTSSKSAHLCLFRLMTRITSSPPYKRFFSAVRVSSPWFRRALVCIDAELFAGRIRTGAGFGEQRRSRTRVITRRLFTKTDLARAKQHHQTVGEQAAPAYPVVSTDKLLIVNVIAFRSQHIAQVSRRFQDVATRAFSVYFKRSGC